MTHQPFKKFYSFAIKHAMDTPLNGAQIKNQKNNLQNTSTVQFTK